MKWIAIGAVVACCAVFPRLQENNPIQGFAFAAVLGIGIYAGIFWLLSQLF